jgi:hypothetical protein
MSVYAHRVRQERVAEVAGPDRRLDQTWSTVATWEALVAPPSASSRLAAGRRGQRVDVVVRLPVDSAAAWETLDRVVVETGPPGLAGLVFDVDTVEDSGRGARLLCRRREA